MNSVTLKPNVLTGDENEKKEKLNKALRNKVCLDSNVLSKESAQLLVTEEEIENDKNKSSLHERFRNSDLKNILVLARSILLKSPKIVTN